MELFRRRSSGDSGVTFLERALHGLSAQRTDSTAVAERSELSEDSKGPLGLNLLYVPSEATVEFIFVHGLGGGSRKTWAKTSNPYHYWPKEWLSRDPDFYHVRVYSFGYVADWGEKKDSVLDIHDFAYSLLGEIKNAPQIGRDNTRIVLIGHSMGGLVIKKAYILARQDPAFSDLASRFHSVFFLATPHRGSDLARTLSSILRVTYGQKPYVNDLERNSSLISTVNDTFRHYAQDLRLWSFYETLPTNVLLSNALVVDKFSAILGYAQERTALLNADHRGVCKFDKPSDPNYKTIRNALSTTVDLIAAEASHLRHEASRNDLRRLGKFLGISDRPEDDFRALEDTRLAGSCNWFTSKKSFEEWRVHWSSAPSVLWLSGNPASGKSVLASHVISHLEEHQLDCSYFFFKGGMATKSSVGDCLRSLAYQMALCNEETRKRLLVLESDGVTYEKDNERVIWRKLFLNAVLQTTPNETHYWVLDALDECNNFHYFFSMLSSIDIDKRLRIFITSRKTHDIERGFGQISKNLIHQEILVSDTVNDIKSFVASRIDRLPVDDSNSRMNLSNKILAKANGSFLWVRLVVQELEHAWSAEAIEEVLNEIPTDMSLLYARTLTSMAKLGRGARLAKAILKWTTCASRALTLPELQCAIKLDVNETVHNLDKSIGSICGQLVFVDQQSRVQMIHQTAREFLLQEDLESEFALKKVASHLSLAVKCLEVLSGNYFKGLRAQNQKLGIKPTTNEDFALADYASMFFSDHLYKASSVESELMDALYDFLNSNILFWIEHIAKTGDLYHITHAAMNIKAYLGRRAKYFPPIGRQFKTVEAWSVDLIRVCTKFGRFLLTSPSSIHWLVPPMCPAESIIFQEFGSPHRGLAVKGLKTLTWDDCLTRIDYQKSQTSAINYGDLFFVVGLSTGKILLYHTISSQLYKTLEHAERVKLLEFGSQDKILASSGLRMIRIWDVSNGNQIQSFQISHQALALAFTSKNECLLAATQGDYITCLGLPDGGERGRIPWHDSFEKGNNQTRRQPPTHASFSPDCSLIAVSYRGRPVLLFDINSETVFGECNRDSDLPKSSASTHYPIVAMTFNPNHEANLLITSYGDGELTTYDTRTLRLKHRIPTVNAQALACSPDGRTLATGSPFGTIQLFDFEGPESGSLTLMYRINAYEDGIKSIAFSNNSLRFIDIRGSQCRVWEPAILVRKDMHDGNQSEVSDPVSTSVKSIGIEEGETKQEITAMTCNEDNDVVFCGKQDGTVTAYNSLDGSEICLLYKHTTNIAITSITWGNLLGILASADESGRVIIRKITKAQKEWTPSDILADKRLGESINGLLMSTSSDRLLVSGKNFEDLYTTQAQKLGSRTFKPQISRKAVCHPLQPDNFMILGREGVQLFKWTNFEEVINLEGIRVDRASEQHVTDSILNNPYRSPAVIAELTKENRDQSSARLECWQIFDLQASHAFTNSLPGFDMLGSNIEYVIAVSGSKLFFLDIDSWVCSLDVTKFSKTPQVRRHFFIPSDWRDGSTELLFQMTSKNEFIFAKRNELVVITRWMDHFEEILLAAQQSAVMNQSKSLDVSTKAISLIEKAGSPHMIVSTDF